MFKSAKRCVLVCLLACAAGVLLTGCPSVAPKAIKGTWVMSSYGFESTVKITGARCTVTYLSPESVYGCKIKEVGKYKIMSATDSSLTMQLFSGSVSPLGTPNEEGQAMISEVRQSLQEALRDKEEVTVSYSLASNGDLIFGGMAYRQK